MTMSMSTNNIKFVRILVLFYARHLRTDLVRTNILLYKYINRERQRQREMHVYSYYIIYCHV